MDRRFRQAGHLWHQGRWQTDATLAVDAAGRIAAPGDMVSGEKLGEWVLPGMVNCHSHAFQRAMAGRVERRLHAHDSFWSWRELMYAFAAAVTPDQMRAIAGQLYLEMLKSGYTRVCEFHYVHRRPDGGLYDDPAAMSLALVEAAAEVGIGLTMLPVLYMTGGFDGRPLSERQRRFGLDVDEFLDLVARLRRIDQPGLNVGIALHSLRAVPPQALHEILAAPLTQAGPVHIHIAEQPAEVADCQALHGARPVEWLLDNTDVDARWCLVHATHVTDGEVQTMTASGATVGLCPTTEANLGDGIFPLADYLEAGGHIAIGSDSNTSISPVEELRWLEYGQRLTSGRRLVAAAEGASVGEALWQATVNGGHRAAGQPAPLTTGASADLLVLDDTAPLLAGQDADSMLDGLVFAGNTPLVRDVMTAGQWRIRDFRHPHEHAIGEAFRAAVSELTAAGSAIKS